MEYGCIGKKLSHSFSKEIHGKIADYPYELVELSKENLHNFMIKREFKAINVTIPYKTDVMPYLDEISNEAKAIGAVNTIVNHGGKLYGYNTDFLGLSALIAHAGINLSGKKVLILGSGGTAKTAFAVAGDMGAAEIFRVSRSAKNGCITYEQAKNSHADAQIIINTTPCGMYPNLFETPIDIDAFPELTGVIDAIYNPLRSELVLRAKEKGIKAEGGLYMLVSQGIFAAEIFTGGKTTVDETDRIYREMVNAKENIVLIGMPGCGKTTLGKALADELQREFIDTDEEIVKSEGKPITEIFESVGETGFRKTESQVIARIAAKQSCVIATGGGAVLRNENIRNLKANGKLYFLDRPLNELVVTADRPLSSDKESLVRRYNERYEIYRTCADFIINATGNVNIKELLK